MLHCQGIAYSIGYVEISRKEFLAVRTAADGKKIDDLNEQASLAAALRGNPVDELFQPGDESIVPDAQKGSGGYIADPGCLHHQGGGPSPGEPPVPIEVVPGDVSVFSCPPRHHGRYPRSVAKVESSGVKA